MPNKLNKINCKICGAEMVTYQIHKRGSTCPKCFEKDRSKAIKKWYEKTKKRYPWKYDSSVILVIEP